MAEIDKQKEIIGFLKTLFFFLLSAIFGLIGFVFMKYQILNEIQLILINIVTFLLLIAIIGVGIKLKREIDKIGEME